MGIVPTIQNGEIVGYVSTIVNGDITTTIYMDSNAVQTGKSTNDASTGKTTSSSKTSNQDGSYVETLSDITYRIVEGSVTNEA